MPNFTKEILLPEHNSSMLLFINDDKVNNGRVKLLIEDTTESQYCTETSNYQYNNSWLLGKLNNYIWLLEDVGQYDLNHEHTCKIYYIDYSTYEEVVLFNVTRVYEYGEECDRLYLQHSGGLKALLVDPEKTTFTNDFYIKYERNLPGCKEEISTEVENGKTKHYVSFYKYDNVNEEVGLTEIMAISNELLVTDDVGNPIPVIKYCKPNIQQATIDFSRICIDYTLAENNTNDLKIGILGVNSSTKKFISSRIYYNCLEPSYYIIQPPKNRSWICYRTCYTEYSNLYFNNISMPNNINCGYLNREGSGLIGHYGTLNNGEYAYEISIAKNGNPFHLMIPTYFTDWTSIGWKENNTDVSYDGNQPFDFFNVLDGTYYKIYSLPETSRINKIIIRY